MATTASAAATYSFGLTYMLPPKPSQHSILPLKIHLRNTRNRKQSRSTNLVVMVKKTEGNGPVWTQRYPEEDSKSNTVINPSVAKKMARKRSERYIYLVAAIMSTIGLISAAGMAIYYRFSRQMSVGMEFWARWAHRALWHASLWDMHESHHRPREGPFEVNDIFAVINAFPAIALLYYGFNNKGLLPGLCFGAGLGITVFGMAYMFVHDGLVHRRFPIGPIANVPYLQRVAAAHKLHHSEKFDGVPYGLFLGPKELEEVGGLEELEKEIKRRFKLSKSSF